MPFVFSPTCFDVAATASVPRFRGERLMSAMDQKLTSQRRAGLSVWVQRADMARATNSRAEPLGIIGRCLGSVLSFPRSRRASTACRTRTGTGHRGGSRWGRWVESGCARTCAQKPAQGQGARKLRRRVRRNLRGDVAHPDKLQNEKGRSTP